MSFERDIHRAEVATWFAGIVGRPLAWLIGSALVVRVTLAYAGSDGVIVAGLAGLIGLGGTVVTWTTAEAPLPDPERYPDDE